MHYGVLSRASILTALAILPTGLAQTPQSGPQEVRVSSGPYNPFKVRAESTEVQVAVVVRDGKGRTISGLQKDDFRLSGQGKDRDIADFTIDVRDTPGGVGTVVAAGRESSEAADKAPAPSASREHPPRFIALFFDDIGTKSGDLGRMKLNARRFVDDGTVAGDRIAVVASSIGRITEFLTDKKQIEDAIAKVEAHPRFPPGGSTDCPRITPYEAYLIAVMGDEQEMQMKILEYAACAGTQPDYRGSLPQNPALAARQFRLDPKMAILRSQAETTWNQVKTASQATMDVVGAAITDLARQNGTRMLLLLSSGFLTGSLEEREDSLADRARAAGVVINAMDAKGLYVEPPVRPFDEPAPMANTLVQVTAYENLIQNGASEVPTAIMADLAEATGGLFFRHNNDFSFGFRELGVIPEVTYLLGFHPDEAALDGKYHKLKVHLASPHSYTTEARPGYFAAPRPAPVEDAKRAQLDRQVTGTEAVQQFPATVAVQFGAKNASGSTAVRVQMHVDLKGLAFGQQDNRHTQKLTFVFAMLDQKDAIVSAREGSMEFALSDGKYQSMQDSGVNAVLTLTAPAGTYRLRTVATEGRSGQVAALTNVIQVP